MLKNTENGSSEVAPLLSLREFSRRCGLSPATVSRVFSGSRRVTDPVRRKVLDMAQVTGFRPSAVGRAAFGGSTRAVGVMLGRLFLDYYRDIFLGIQKEFMSRNHLPILLEVDAPDEVGVALHRLVDHRVDAVILSLPDEKLERDSYSEYLPDGFPVVYCGIPLPTWNCDSVDTDDFEGGRQAAEHLLALGHRRALTVLFGENRCNSALPRAAGFAAAFALAGAPAPRQAFLPPRSVPGDASIFDTLAEELKVILDAPDRPTAVFATTDNIARFVCQFAAQRGLRVPDDLSVIGYSGMEMGAWLQPPLTTIRQDGVEVGRLAARAVLERLVAADRSPRRVLVPIRLLERGSTARPPE